MKLPQVSLRDLFWLVLLVACLCGWAVDHWHWVKVIENLKPETYTPMSGPGVISVFHDAWAE